MVMSDKKKKKLTPIQQEYQDFAKKREPKRPVFKNCFFAFIIGGTICLIGQLFSAFYIHFFGFNQQSAGDPTVATLVFLSALFTGLGIYDHIAQVAGAGTIIPVTGFANAIASAAIEHRSEGYVLGVGGHMFKLAGSVIVFGVFSAFVIGIIKVLFTKYIGG
jgi:stage V sporulation protein AC